MNINLSTIQLSGRGTPRELKCCVLQSPLAGVSDQIFRGLVRRWAPDALLFTEMMNASSLELGHGRNKIEELSKESGPIGVQLFDHHPKAMAEAAKRAEAAGAFLIDINMGCPAKKIARKGGGSALIKNPLLAARIINTVVDAVKIPVTVKTRLGWQKNSHDPVEFALLMQAAGAQLITLHGRTREQGFRGAADWEAIGRVKKNLSIPVIANGDVNNAEDAYQCLKKTGADGLMIGRASMGAPWLVGQINSTLQGNAIQTPSPYTKVSVALEHLQALLASKGDHGLLIARKHLGWTCRGFPGASKLRYSLLRAQTPLEAEALLQKELISLS